MIPPPLNPKTAHTTTSTPSPPPLRPGGSIFTIFCVCTKCYQSPLYNAHTHSLTDDWLTVIGDWISIVLSLCSWWCDDIQSVCETQPVKINSGDCDIKCWWHRFLTLCVRACVRACVIDCSGGGCCFSIRNAQTDKTQLLSLAAAAASIDSTHAQPDSDSTNNNQRYTVIA